MVLKKKKSSSGGDKSGKSDKSSGGKKKFVYRGGERTSEDVAKATKESGGNFDSMLKGITPYKVKDGENRIRILPFSWKDTKKWGRNWYIGVDVHYGVGADRQSYLCLKMNDEDCPVCAARAETSDEDEKKQLRANRRAFSVDPIDRENEKAGVMAWAMPLTLSKDISGRSSDKKTGQPILIDDPEAGFDVSFVTEGKEIQRKYTRVELDRDASALSENPKRMEKWLDQIAENPLPDVLQFFDADHIEGVMTGTKSRKDEENEDEEGEEDEEAEGDDDEGEEDEDDTPRRKRGKADKGKAGKSKSKKGDDDDDDDDGEGEDDEEAEDDEEGEGEEEEGDGDEESEDDDESEGDGDGDEDEEGEDEEEDEDPPPRRKGGKGKPEKSKSKSKKGDDDDDDEGEEDEDEEGDDEEEEDDPPKKGKSAAERARARFADAKKKRKK